MKPPYPIRSVVPHEIIDILTDRWNLYVCDVILIDGTIIENCSIEGSTFEGEEIVDYHSLMDEAGNPISSWVFESSSAK